MENKIGFHAEGWSRQVLETNESRNIKKTKKQYPCKNDDVFISHFIIMYQITCITHQIYILKSINIHDSILNNLGQLNDRLQLSAILYFIDS